MTQRRYAVAEPFSSDEEDEDGAADAEKKLEEEMSSLTVEERKELTELMEAREKERLKAERAGEIAMKEYAAKRRAEAAALAEKGILNTNKKVLFLSFFSSSCLCFLLLSLLVLFCLFFVYLISTRFLLALFCSVSHFLLFFLSLLQPSRLCHFYIVATHACPRSTLSFFFS